MSHMQYPHPCCKCQGHMLSLMVRKSCIYALICVQTLILLGWEDFLNYFKTRRCFVACSGPILNVKVTKPCMYAHSHDQIVILLLTL